VRLSLSLFSPERKTGRYRAFSGARGRFSPRKKRGASGFVRGRPMPSDVHVTSRDSNFEEIFRLLLSLIGSVWGPYSSRSSTIDLSSSSTCSATRSDAKQPGSQAGRQAAGAPV